MLEKRYQSIPEPGAGGWFDRLTGLPNDRALEIDLAADSICGLRPDLTGVAVIVLEGIRQVTARLGGASGDYFVMTFVEGLRREFGAGVALYRPRRNEFVLLGIEVAAGGLRVAYNLERVLQAVRDEEYPEVGARLGVAAMAEADGTLYGAFRFADARAYALEAPGEGAP